MSHNVTANDTGESDFIAHLLDSLPLLVDYDQIEMDELLHHCLRELSFDGDLGKRYPLRQTFQHFSTGVRVLPIASISISEGIMLISF